jgi:hypothetical protein
LRGDLFNLTVISIVRIMMVMYALDPGLLLEKGLLLAAWRAA